MWMYKRIVVAQHERALLFRDQQLLEVLEPGVYRHIDPLGRYQVEVHDLDRAVFDNPHGELLLQAAAEQLEDHLETVVMGEQEIGLVYRNNRFLEALPPGAHRVYWKIPYSLRVQRVDVSTDLRVNQELVDKILRRGAAVVPELSAYIHSSFVADHYVGLLLVDDELVDTLEPGFHAFWAVKRGIGVEQYDTRVQTMEVQGQEILSRDKVSLRLNLGAHYRLQDPVLARSLLQRPVDWLYRELQFALRQAVGSRNLDRLLEDKEQVDQEVFGKVAAQAKENGFELLGIGLKDVILPGDMKDILNQVVQAEKAAQANVIRRREETAATRSLLNTARLMDGNPTLLRLKELETLEKVTDKVDRMTVFGGLDGILRDTVKINV